MANVFIILNRLGECHVAPHTDIDFQLRKFQIYIYIISPHFLYLTFEKSCYTTEMVKKYKTYDTKPYSRTI